MWGVSTRPGDGVDDAASRLAKLGRVGIGQHLKFEHRLDTEQNAGHRSRRLVVHVIDVRAIEQETVLLGSRTVDGNLRGASADDVAARGKSGGDARLQERELLKRPPVQRKIANLPIVDQAAHAAVGEIDARRLTGDAHRGFEAANLEREIDDERLANGQLYAASGDRLEAAGRDVDLVCSRRQNGHAIASGPVARQLEHRAGRQVQDDDLRVWKGRAGRIGDEALEARADRLSPGRLNAWNGEESSTNKRHDESAPDIHRHLLCKGARYTHASPAAMKAGTGGGCSPARPVRSIRQNWNRNWSCTDRMSCAPVAAPKPALRGCRRAGFTVPSALY